ncbi:hypothetical protein BH20ACT2_BH20ACT2_06650 [soil metagenome]
MTPDPLDVLRRATTPVAPRAAFAAELRRRIEAELGGRPDPETRSDPVTTTVVSTTLTPYLVMRRAAEAIDFYKEAFGAIEIYRLAQPDGRVGHAELAIGDARFYLADEFPEMDILGPESLGGSPVKLQLVVDDVDAVFARAVAAGARVLRPVEDQFYGDRNGQIVDPFGHGWSLSTPIEEVSPAEMQRRNDTPGDES